MEYSQTFSAHIGTNVQKHWSVASATEPATAASTPVLKNNPCVVWFFESDCMTSSDLQASCLDFLILVLLQLQSKWEQ